MQAHRLIKYLPSSERPRSRDLTVDGVGGPGNSHLTNQDHGFQTNNKKKQWQEWQEGKKRLQETMQISS